MSVKRYNLGKEKKLNIIGDYISDLKKEFTGYNSKKLAKDIMAGITVAAVALPLALAFGVSSGATAAAGLITAIIGGIVIGVFSGASFQMSGPTGAMTAILVTLAAKYGMQGIFIASFFAGIILIVAGIFKLGRIIYFIPSSVITGFTSGIAVIIALGQLDNFFGVTSKGDLAIMKLVSYFTDGFNPDIPTMCIGLAVVIFMFIWPQKLNAKIPSSLVAIILVLIVNHFAKFDVAVVGDIPKTIFLDERLSITSVSIKQFWDLVIPALSIAALAMIESLLCVASASKLKKEDYNADRELIAQGIGNVLIPFFGGVPATAAIARTSVAIKAGCETRMAGVVHALILLLSMFVLAPVMSAIPLSALAGVLIVTAWRMNDWENIKFIFNNHFKTGMAKFFITMGATIVLDLTQAIIIGVSFAAILIVVRMTDIEINTADIDDKKLKQMGIDHTDSFNKIKVVYLTGTIFFAVTEKIKNKLTDIDGAKIIILSMRGVPVIDLSGIQAMLELVEELEAEGIKVMLTSVQPKVESKLRQGGLMDIIGEKYVFQSAEFAILEAGELLEEARKNA